MKEYRQGRKFLLVDKFETVAIFSFYNGKVLTHYYKPFKEYESFLNYMLDVWFNVKRGNHV